MTEGKTTEIIQESIESSKSDEICESWGTLVTKSHVRLKIWQILKLFGELNVTQISNLVEDSKSTISRHLNGMEEDGLVKSREVQSTYEGRISPKLYCINDDIEKIKCGMDQNQGLPKDFIKRIEFIKSEIQANRASIEMISGIMKLLIPIYDEVEGLVKKNTSESLQKAEDVFKNYMWGEDGENITWFKFNYVIPQMYDLQCRINEWSYKALKEDADPKKIEEERLKLQTELAEANLLQKDPKVSKKYARLGIDLPLRNIFKKNLVSK